MSLRFPGPLREPDPARVVGELSGMKLIESTTLPPNEILIISGKAVLYPRGTDPPVPGYRRPLWSRHTLGAREIDRDRAARKRFPHAILTPLKKRTVITMDPSFLLPAPSGIQVDDIRPRDVILDSLSAETRAHWHRSILDITGLRVGKIIGIES